jgi:GNAT superfamily N-acetyltransferase
MITFQTEPFAKFIQDGKEIFAEHNNEVVLQDKQISLDVNYKAYFKLAEADKLEVCTIRDNGKLVGYTLWMLHYHIHYKTSLTANSTLIYVVPEYRKGLLGYKLIKWSINKLKERGVQRLMMGVKPNYDFGRLLERLGASHFEKIYTIALD